MNDSTPNNITLSDLNDAAKKQQEIAQFSERIKSDILLYMKETSSADHYSRIFGDEYFDVAFREDSADVFYRYDTGGEITDGVAFIPFSFLCSGDKIK